jgi:hypothetical protein
MAVDSRATKLLESIDTVLQQKGITETPRAFLEATLNNMKVIDEALAEYQKKNGEDFVNRQIQLSYGKGAIEYLLIFL